MSLFHRLHAFD